MTPSARTLAHMRAAGYVGDITERWLPRVNRRKDFLGIGDAIFCRPATGEVVMVQSTSLSNVAARVKKAKANPHLASWLRCASFAVHGWYKQPSGRWAVKVVELQGADLEAVVACPVKRRSRAVNQATLFDAAGGAN